ncbi:MAG TPA: 50S ribosomal protein L28 [Rhodospirillaceae bacterium]|jgi:large subunit ribosomal protein L28|nr:50S ribosomal protein L28 [Alphaproteobacteria bacterium]HBH26019.1 50S ribosomal protein L28 [Rhodospirillaceae bacterium]
MARRCVITGKGAQVGNNVSHAHNKTKRRFLPNIQSTSLYSETLGRWVRLRLSAHGLRTVEHKGGLDAFLASTPRAKLDASLRPLKAQLEKAKA